MDPDQFVTPLLDQATISKLISLLNKSSGEVEKAKPRCLTGTQCIIRLIDKCTVFTKQLEVVTSSSILRKE